MPKFEVLRPDNLPEACGLLARYSAEGAAVLAGGTDILVNIRRPIIPAHLPRCHGCGSVSGRAISTLENPPKYLIALSKIPELRGVTITDNGDIIIGAMTTITELYKSVIVQSRLKALSDGAENLGSPLVRNRGSIGGNICNARPAADALVPAYALSARLELVWESGQRVIPVEDFILGPGKTAIRPDEILARIVFPSPGENCGSAFIKLANRKALEIAIVNAASVLKMDLSGENIIAARISLGAVGPTPVLAHKAAEFLSGKTPSPANFRQAGEIAAGECRPITDHRGSKTYRADMVKTIVFRTLSEALKQIKQQHSIRI